MDYGGDNMNYLKSLGIDPRLIKIGKTITSGIRRFLELDDTPDSYDGQAGKVVKVNEEETALKFEEMAGGGDMLKSVYDTDDDGTVDNADKVDGQHASEFAAASHDHSGVYAPISHQHAGSDITSQVLDSDKLDGYHATSFAAASHTHPGTDITSQVSDSDKLDGQHASAFASASHTHTAYMEKATYDTDSDGIVDNSEKLEGHSASYFAEASHNHNGVYAPTSHQHPGTDITSQVSDSDKLDGQDASAFASATHNHDATYAPISKGVTNGDNHDHSGGDGAAITESALSLSDATMANASATKHGFCPKLPDDDTKFLDGKGNWSVPAGGETGEKGKIIFADSCELADVQAAIAAADPGDTVIVPNGTAV